MQYSIMRLPFFLLLLLLVACSVAPPKEQKNTSIKLQRIPEEPIPGEMMAVENTSEAEQELVGTETTKTGDYFPAAKLPEEKTIIVGVRSERSLKDEDEAHLGSEKDLNSAFDEIKTRYKIWAHTIEDSGLTTPKRTPFLVHWCGGEWCSHVKNYTLTHERKLLKDADVSAPTIKVLPQGETLNKATIFTKVLKVGKYSKGKESYPVITYSGEGNWVIYDDQELDTAEYYPGDSEVTLIEPKVEEWIYVETADGKTGWIKEVNRHTLPFRPSR